MIEPSSTATRRRLLAGAAAVGAWTIVGPWRALAAGLRPTPAQTTGPFYPRELPLDRDNDLAAVAGEPARAQGTLTHVFGTVRDVDGKPIRGARVEIWQCNAFGRYHHPNDTRNAPIDPGFQGFGQTVTTDDGTYRFRTIKPVPYPGRTPHIHIAVRPDFDEPFVTQLYVQGESRNAGDALFNAIPPERRRLVVADFAPAGNTFAAKFDIILGATPLG